MINILKSKNAIPCYTVCDEAFRAYGRVRSDIDTAEIVAVGEQVAMPEAGASYTPSLDAFEALPVAAEIGVRCFGDTPAEIGFCWGYNSALDALEWHCCNEINIAVTDAVLILAKLADLDENNKLDSAKCKAFFVPKGTAVEVYSDSLHYCPCQVSDDGFRMVVGLSEGTNTPLDEKTDDPTFWMRNKWLIAHEDNAALLADGAYAGISGENYTIKY